MYSVMVLEENGGSSVILLAKMCTIIECGLAVVRNMFSYG